MKFNFFHHGRNNIAPNVTKINDSCNRWSDPIYPIQATPCCGISRLCPFIDISLHKIDYNDEQDKSQMQHDEHHINNWALFYGANKIKINY